MKCIVIVCPVIYVTFIKRYELQLVELVRSLFLSITCEVSERIMFECISTLQHNALQEPVYPLHKYRMQFIRVHNEVLLL